MYHIHVHVGTCYQEPLSTCTCTSVHARSLLRRPQHTAPGREALSVYSSTHVQNVHVHVSPGKIGVAGQRMRFPQFLWLCHLHYMYIHVHLKRALLCWPPHVQYRSDAKYKARA